jgi:leader peptidase (prepilin peptidase)/N-methyltransferase
VVFIFTLIIALIIPFFVSLIMKEKLNIKRWYIPFGIIAFFTTIMYIAFGESLIFIKGFLFALCVIYASISDIKSFEVDDSISLLTLCVGFVGISAVNALLGLLTALPFFIIALLTKRCGGADIKFSAAIGFVLGLWGGLVSCVVGMAIALIVFSIKNRKSNADNKIPLIPFIGFSALIYYIIGGMNLC